MRQISELDHKQVEQYRHRQGWRSCWQCQDAATLLPTFEQIAADQWAASLPISAEADNDDDFVEDGWKEQETI